MGEAWTPAGFAEEILGLKLYPWQKEVLSALMPPHTKVTLRAANEVGKTSVVALSLVMWHMSLFPHSKVVCTSGVWRQVIEQLWPHIKRWGTSFGWEVTQKSADNPINGAHAVGFSTAEEGKFEGFHAIDHVQSPLLIIVDEAKTVDDGIFRAIERCRPTRLIVMSSPGADAGGFYETCQDPRYTHFKVTAFDCAHLGAAKAEEVAIRWGRDSMLYKSMIMGEWQADPNQLYCVSRRAIDKCMASNSPILVGGLCAALDVAHAESGDENVIAIKHGNVTELEDCFVGNGDANYVVDRIIGRLERRRIHPSAVWIDGDGLGNIYANVFQAKGWPLNIWRGGDPAFDHAYYHNKISEAYMQLARMIESEQVKLPNDATLIKQLTSREYFINDKGKIQMVKKGGNSPDRADAVVMVNGIKSMRPIQAMESLSDKETLSKLDPTPTEMIIGKRDRYNDYAYCLNPGWNVGG